MLRPAFGRFLLELKLNNCSPLTLAAYKSDFAAFCAFLGELGLPLDFSSLDAKVIRAFALHMAEKGAAPATIRRRLYCLRSFGNFCIQEELVAKNAAREVQMPKKGRRLPVYLTREEVDRLLAAVDAAAGVDAVRDRALLRLLVLAGPRRSEVLALTWNQVDFAGETVIFRGKGNRERSVPMHPDLRRALFRLRAVTAPGPQDHVFLHHGRPLGKDGLTACVRRYARAAGIAKRVTPHVLRHTFATLLSQAGADIREVQELLGHADIGTTAKYTHTSARALRRAVGRLLPGPAFETSTARIQGKDDCALNNPLTHSKDENGNTET